MEEREIIAHTHTRVRAHRFTLLLTRDARARAVVPPSLLAIVPPSLFAVVPPSLLAVVPPSLFARHPAFLGATLAENLPLPSGLEFPAIELIVDSLAEVGRGHARRRDAS